MKNILSHIGLALKQDLIEKEHLTWELNRDLKHAQLQNARLQHENEQAATFAKDNKKKYERLHHQHLQLLNMQHWCLPHMIEFPVGTPVPLHENTMECIDIMLKGSEVVADLIQKDKFLSPAKWALYWSLTHAAYTASLEALAPVNEDSLSRKFLQALENQATKATSLINDTGSLQLAYTAIFDQSLPALKEVSVGADILLIVAGKSLIPGGFARIFWIQAKKAESKSPFKLEFERRSKQGLQVEALSRVHAPQRGSFGLYMQYSDSLPYVSSVSVNRLPWKEGKLKDNLSAIGTRFQEFIVARTCRLQDVGVFENTRQLRDYLDEVSDMNPLYVVTATASDEPALEKRTEIEWLSDISNYYLEKLGLTRNRNQQLSRDRDQDSDRDRGNNFDYGL